MTICGLIRKLEHAQKTLGPRARVTVDLRELANSADDEIKYWELNCFDTATVRWMKDDSFELKSGAERMRSIVVLS